MPASRTNAGSYTVTITGKGNYGGEIQKEFTITRAKLTITADDKSKEYGDPDPALTATKSATIGNETIDYLILRDEGVNTGTYAITITGLLLQGNYELTFKPGTLTITPKETISGAVTITEDENGISVVIDGDSEGDVNFTKEIKNAKVTYKRKLYADVTTTIILPFAFSQANFDNETFNTLNYVEYNTTNQRWEAHMLPVDELKANTPYMFKPTATTAHSDGSQTEIDFGKVDIQPTTGKNQTEKGDWTLQGVYAYQKWTERQSRIYGFAANKNTDETIKQGDFVRAGAGSYIKTTRVYLEYSENGKETALLSKSATELPERIVVIFDEPDQTADDPNGDITTPVSEITPNANIKVWSFDKTINIIGASGKEYRIVDMGGRPLKNGTAQSDREQVQLSHSGIAIVIVGNKAYKVAY